MNTPSIVFEQTREIHLFHSGPDGLATLPSLCRFAQESAGQHAALLGVGFEHLAARGLGWVLREHLMQVRRYPALGEKVTLRTWPTRAERILCYRDFRFTDQAGEVIALGTSSWFGLDLEARRPCKAGSFFNLDWTGVPAPVFADSMPALERLHQAPDAQRTVRTSELDALGHMNNLRYMDWVIDYLAEAGLAPHRVRGMQVRHVRELTAGEIVRLACVMHEDGACLEMLRANEDRELCLARVWLGRKAGAKASLERVETRQGAGGVYP